MEKTEVKYPSFPDVTANILLESCSDTQWQVLCGDKDHWRVGYYSPVATSLEEVGKLEKHSCPELFLLLEGKVTLLLSDGKGIRTLELEKFKPVLVDSWHNGFCPEGPLYAKVLIVERDHFHTEYRVLKDFKP